jgi:hypothetical protein
VNFIERRFFAESAIFSVNKSIIICHGETPIATLSRWCFRVTGDRER